MRCWAPRLGASGDSIWIWAFSALGVVVLAAPLAVGFRDPGAFPGRS